MIATLPWPDIDTVLLDMDGTLLDLHFDNHFWLELLPQRYAELHGISRAMAELELAPLFNEHVGIGAKLEVVAMQGWSRDQYFDSTGLPWVLPSPNLPTLDSAVVYPGTRRYSLAERVNAVPVEALKDGAKGLFPTAP